MEVNGRLYENDIKKKLKNEYKDSYQQIIEGKTFCLFVKILLTLLFFLETFHNGIFS